jgi:hypothetical protein
MADYTRTKATITDNATGKRTTYTTPDGTPSINAAKRESRKLQASGATVQRG